MRRLSTLPRLAEHSSTAVAARSASICLFCQHQSTSSSSRRRTLTTTTSRPARTRPAEPSSNPDFLERTRRRIWGTDTPPGAADPYARPAPIEESEVSPLEEGELQDADSARAMAEDQYRTERADMQQQVEQAPMHVDYVPATTWEGLEMVGGEKEWDEGRRVFSGFLNTNNKVTNPTLITLAIYRATTEVFAALGAGRTPRVSKNYHIGDLHSSAATQATLQYNNETGEVSVTYPDVVTEQAVLKAGAPAVIADELAAAMDLEEEIVNSTAISSELDPRKEAQLKATIASWGRSWRQIPLEDMKVKFAITKRLTRLLGRTIPDNFIHQSQTVNDLVALLAVPPPPKTLFQTLTGLGKLEGLGNVVVNGRRQTPVDKEKELGRWKVIERELRDRGLPVVGRG